ncbi:S-adenosyl-L-methionine-dependent methyltransferase [Gilbertella persicaria]|nr:S-adenosyl-L-methionine-dependent methyltransferase [Gilbertella persicaria]KAI8059939.1 S-adenosyl-L-methionine-dependent methyltransferase [Gilbertella persicaria]
MGNQASKVLSHTINKEKRSGVAQRPLSTTSQGNYDWLEQDPYSSPMDAAISAVMSKKNKKNISLEPPSAFSNRRKSISEFFARRKQSLIGLHPYGSGQEDMKEFDRLQRQHYLLKSTRKGNTWAPIQSPKVIVESGTQNGIWALEMATQYTDSQVLGLDLKPPALQPGSPSNLRYNQTNITESWPMNDNSIDFIFQRNMYLSVQKDQWPSLLEEMFRVLKPGGYIELLEAEIWYHNPGPVQQAFQTFFRDQCKELELDLDFAESLSTLLEEKGFESIEKRVLDIPVGEWPTEPELKQFGFINKEIQKASLKNKKGAYVPKWGISPAEYDLAVNEVLGEFEDYQSFSRYNCWIARKPL